MHGVGFCCAIGAAGSGTRGFPPGGYGSSAEVDPDGLGIDNDVVSLGSLDGTGGVDLCGGGSWAACMGCKEELEVLDLVGNLGGSLGAGAFSFPFNMGGAAT